MSDEIVSGPYDYVESATPAKPLPKKPGAEPSRPVRVLVPVLLVSAYWIAYLSLTFVELASFPRFLWQLLALVLMALPYTIWWLALYRGMRFWQRLAVFLAMIAVGAVAVSMLHPSVLPPVPILLTLPWLFTLGTLWLLAARAASANVQMYGLLALAVIGWTPTPLIRMEGMSGEGESALHWRWSPSAEELYLAQQKQNAKATPVKLDEPLELSLDDWPRFRGPDGDSALHGVKIAADWDASPPKQLWRKRIGPGWSSFAVVAGRLFTQDQRGSAEAVAAYDADTGDQIWVHKDAKTRFEESMGGPGPRATPTYVDGRLYTLGAKGTLNCLDAETGQPLWTRNIAEDAAGPSGEPEVPMWAYSSSPLVEGDLVYVFAGSPNSDKNLLAYDIETGEPAWTAKAGTHSYSSPQLATIAGRKQILFVSDKAVAAFDPATGAELWKYEAKSHNGYSSIQANFVSPSQLVCSFAMEMGITSLDVTLESNDKWNVALKWESNDMNPFFNDFVVYDGALYGFDNDIFCSIDAKTGKRNWKGGRYDTGQVLLLADQPLLLVTSEWGEVVLVAVDPKKHRELGRFKAFDGKTWNHPVVVGNRLYLRNSEEMACYELTRK
jgi:outer membrane protein assembly factor BamB